MSHQLILAPKSGTPSIGAPGDRGCVSCSAVISTDKTPLDREPRLSDRKMFLGDARDRYWCLDCAADALANVRRRVDERTDYDYPWCFEDTGGLHGQHIRTKHPPKSLRDEVLTKFEAEPSAAPDVEISQELVDAMLSTEDDS